MKANVQLTLSERLAAFGSADDRLGHLATGVRLLIKNAHIDTLANWPQQDQTALAAIDVPLSVVAANNDAALLIRDDIDALTDVFAIYGFDIVGSTRWPAP